MTFKIMPSVGKQPDIVLTDWSVMRISADGQHWDVMLGWCALNGCGRVTTPINEFVAAEATAITRSGRRYRLAGPPGRNPDAIYVYAQMFGHIPHTNVDITAEYLELMAR